MKQNFVKNIDDESDESDEKYSSENTTSKSKRIVKSPKGNRTLRSIKMNNDSISTSTLTNDQILIESGRGEKEWMVYFREFERYQEKFGKIALLYQMGDFYEFFGVDNDEEQLGNIREIFKVLNIHLSKVGIGKNPNLFENDREEHPLKGGFPLNAYNDHVQSLVEYGFTVVEISQTGNTIVSYDDNQKNKEEKKERALIRVVTPSTFIDEIDSSGNSSYAVAIFVTNYTRESQKEEIRLKGWKECVYSIGMSAIDWSTNGSDGVSYEAHDKSHDSTYAMNEVYRFLHSFNPKEVIVTYKSSFEFEDNSNSSDSGEALSEVSFQDFLKKELELQRFSVSKIGKASKESMNLNYQTTLLERVYPKRGMLPVIDYLQLDRKMHALTSFVELLNFAYERDARILHSLGKPQLWFTDKHLMLSNNAIYQLHLLHFKEKSEKSSNQSAEPGLLDILDRTKTPMGSRMLKYDMLNPIVDENELCQRYDMIEMLDREIEIDGSASGSSGASGLSGEYRNENGGEGSLDENGVKKQYIFNVIRKYLSHISDIEKMYRHIELGIIRPPVMVKLHYAHHELIKMLEWMKEEEYLNDFFCEEKAQNYQIDNATIKKLKKFVKKCSSLFDMEKMGACYQINRVDESFLKKGSGFPHIDELQEKIDLAKDSQESFTSVLSNLIDPKAKTPGVAIKKLTTNSKTKKETFALNCTKPRFRLIDHYLNVIESLREHEDKSGLIFKYENAQTFNKYLKRRGDEEDADEMNIPTGSTCTLNNQEITFLESICEIKREKLKSNVEFQSKYINDSKEIVGDLFIEMNQCMKEAYKEILISFTDDYISDFHVLSRFISRLDIFTNHAKNAREYRYSRPTIISKYNAESDDEIDSDGNCVEKSFIQAKKIRHPIIERILTRTTYTPNDITLGCNNVNGILLFGINNIGKTSYLRSIGLSVLMAQMGSYVPAESFDYFPFHHILTRLSGSDNMYKGQGLYQVEMSELRDITHRCNYRSLVLADELCHGTEQVSANSLVTGGISYLSKRTNFILATHLHDTPNQPELADATNVKYFHLQMTRDPVTNKIIYNRTLQNGPGDSNYGIEVARANGLPDEILITAEAVRKRYLKEESSIVNDKVSRYNAKLYMIPCLNCGEASEETHHIIEQHKADDEGFIDHFHKNVRANTLPLCKACHLKVTLGKLSILPPVVTTDGIELPIIKNIE